jgi:hypothetical protein
MAAGGLSRRSQARCGTCRSGSRRRQIRARHGLSSPVRARAPAAEPDRISASRRRARGEPIPRGQEHGGRDGTCGRIACRGWNAARRTRTPLELTEGPSCWCGPPSTPHADSRRDRDSQGACSYGVSADASLDLWLRNQVVLADRSGLRSIDRPIGPAAERSGRSRSPGNMKHASPSSRAKRARRAAEPQRRLGKRCETCARAGRLDPGCFADKRQGLHLRRPTVEGLPAVSMQTPRAA